MILLVLTVFFVTGTVVACALVGGARHTGPHLSPLPGPLRTTPKEQRPELDAR